MFILDAAACEKGVGGLLVRTAIAFAKDCGCARMTLWTMSMLTVARVIYAKEGFRLIASVANVSYGQKVTDETWELTLSRAPLDLL